MAYCRECGAQIGEAKFCPECGAAQALQAQQVTSEPQASQGAQPKPQARRPVLGFVGMLVMAAGLCAALAFDPGFGTIVLGIGAIILVYALVTGNVKFLG
jgi:fatty acid desaturase